MTKQETGHDYNDDGTKVKTWTAHITHDDGTKDTVKLPESHYTAENVHDQAMHMHGVLKAVAALPTVVKDVKTAIADHRSQA